MNDDVKKAIRRMFCATSTIQLHPHQAGLAMKTLKSASHMKPM
jgi:hypothetical protein